MRRKGRNKGHGNRYEEGYGSLQHKRRYHKYTTHILIGSFLDPLRARIEVSGCVVSLVLCYVSHWWLCVVSALCLRVTCVWCRYIRVSSLFFRVLVLFQSKSLQGSFPRPYNSLKVHL